MKIGKFEISNSKLSAVVLIVSGLLAMILGLASALGKVEIPGYKYIDSSYTDVSKFSGIVASHIKYAFAGGLTVTILGIAAVATGITLSILHTHEAKWLLFVFIGLAISLFILSVAAISCQGELNSKSWVADHIGQMPKPTP